MPNRFAGYPATIKGGGSRAQKAMVSAAKDKLASGQKYRASLREPIWERNERQYEGRHWENVKVEEYDGLQLMVVNMSFSTVNTIVPFMTGAEPNFLIQPYGNGADPKHAAMQQVWLNRQWRGPEVNGQNELESSSHDFIIYGDGYMKNGYDIVERRTDGEDLTYAEVAELWVNRVNPWDLWIDPTSDGLHNARWACHRIRMTREEIEESAYKNTAEPNVTYGTYHRTTAQEGGDAQAAVRETFDGTEYAILYEFYDMVNRVKIVFADGDSPLLIIEDLPVLPITQMGNYRIPNSPYHMSELEQLWSIQQELNKSRSHMITHRARNVQKFASRKGLLDADAKQKLRSSVVNELIEFDTDLPADQAIYPLQVPQLSADVYNVSELMERDIYEISGINEYLRGSTPDVRRTATEATIIEGASNVKSQFKLRQVEKLAKRVGMLLLASAADVYPQTDYQEMKLYLTGRDAELIRRHDPGATDQDGMPLPAGPVTGGEMIPEPEMWVGEYEVFVEESSTELRSPVVREQKYRGIVLDAMSILPALAEQGYTMDLVKLISQWLEAAGVDNVEELFVPLGPPQPEPGRVDLELGLTSEDPFEALAALQGAFPGGGNPAPDEVPPDLSMGPFTDQNTGALPPLGGQTA